MSLLKKNFFGMESFLLRKKNVNEGQGISTWGYPKKEIEGLGNL